MTRLAEMALSVLERPFSAALALIALAVALPRLLWMSEKGQPAGQWRPAVDTSRNRSLPVSVWPERLDSRKG